MFRRIFQAAGVLVLLHCSLAWSQEVPILPAPSSIPQLSKQVPIDTAHERTLSAPNARGVSVARATGNAEAAALQFISLSPDLLRAPASNSAGQGRLGLGDGRPKAAVPLTVMIDGQQLEFAAVAETQDPELVYRYVTAQVLNVPNSYARFTVAGDQIVGTIVTPKALYRVLPAGAGQVSVHRLPPGSDQSSRFRPIVAPENVRESALERRHVLMERLAQMQPKHAFVNEQGRYFSVKGGALGKLAGTPSAQSVETVLKGLAEVTWAPESLKVQVSDVTQRANTTIVQFAQSINGIPIAGDNRLVTDANGSVVELTTQFVDPALADNRPIMSQIEARKSAIRQFEYEAGQSSPDYEELQPTMLAYEREGAGPAKLVAYYTFSLRALAEHGRAAAVRVNAHSGEARVMTNPQAFGWRVCTRFINFPSSNPRTCDDSNAWLIFDNTYGAAQGCVAPTPPKDGPIGCKDPGSKNPNFAMKHADIALSKVAGPIVGRTVDVVYRTNATTSPSEYNVSSQTIMSSVGSGLLGNAEVVWHELGHYIFHKISPEVNGVYNLTGFEFESAFQESFADLTSVAIAMNINTTTEVSYGQLWTYADALAGTMRRLDDPAITSFYYMTQQTNHHDRGKAISKYFYRVFTASGMTPKRFFEVLLQVGDTLRDRDASNRIDLTDLRTTLQEIAAGEPALLTAVNNEFSAMYNNIPPNQQPPPIGVPAPPVPARPASISATFTGQCPIVNGVRTSEWRVSWSSVPSAVTYSVTARANGVIWDHAQTSSLFSLAQTNLPNGEVFVQGCNSAGQCGPPSSSVFVSHQPSCNF